MGEGEIEFDKVSFSYPSNNTKVLRSMSFNIPPGKRVALVGHSGCGKSTIANLLLRFYNLEEGQILIDGAPIEDFDVKALRKQIGLVMQEPILFNSTIKENILFGKPDATNEEIFRAAAKANALEFIEMYDD